MQTPPEHPGPLGGPAGGWGGRSPHGALSEQSWHGIKQCKWSWAGVGSARGFEAGSGGEGFARAGGCRPRPCAAALLEEVRAQTDPHPGIAASPFCKGRRWGSEGWVHRAACLAPSPLGRLLSLADAPRGLYGSASPPHLVCQAEVSHAAISLGKKMPFPDSAGHNLLPQWIAFIWERSSNCRRGLHVGRLWVWDTEGPWGGWWNPIPLCRHCV